MPNPRDPNDEAQEHQVPDISPDTSSPVSKESEKSGGEFFEDIPPFTDSEDTFPLTITPFKLRPDKTTPDAVRRDLALPILWFLLTTYALTVGAFLFFRLIPVPQPIFSAEEFTAAIAAISGLQGLGAAVVGFYFGVKQAEK